MLANVITTLKSSIKRRVKRKTTTQTDHRIYFKKKDPFKTSIEIKEELNLNLSLSTIRRRLVEGNLHGRIARTVLSAKNMRRNRISKKSFLMVWKSRF